MTTNVRPMQQPKPPLKPEDMTPREREMYAEVITLRLAVIEREQRIAAMMAAKWRDELTELQRPESTEQRAQEPAREEGAAG